MIPQPLPLASALRTPNPTVNGRFAPATTPAVRHAHVAISPRRQNTLQHPTEASDTGSASAVTFDIDGSHSAVGGTYATPGPLIAYGTAPPGSEADYDSADTNLFPSSGEE